MDYKLDVHVHELRYWDEHERGSSANTKQQHQSFDREQHALAVDLSM